VPGRVKGYVLVVDDEPDVRQSFAFLLDACGILAVAAKHGQEALDIIRSHRPPAVILLDLRMPVVSGEQFLAERQADPVLAAIPIIVVSATADPTVRNRLPGVAAYYQKPADPADLLATVRRLLAASAPASDGQSAAVGESQPTAG